MMNYEKILYEEKTNTDKIYLYPLQGLSGWVVYEASAEHLHGLLPNIPCAMRVISINAVEYMIKVMVIDKLSLNSLLQKVASIEEPTRLVITLGR